MYNKDFREARVKRFSGSMKEALAENRYKIENNIPIDKPLSASSNEDLDALPRLPNKLAARKKKTNTRSRR